MAEPVEAPPNILPKAKHDGHFDKFNDRKSYMFAFLF